MCALALGGEHYDYIPNSLSLHLFELIAGFVIVSLRFWCVSIGFVHYTHVDCSCLVSALQLSTSRAISTSIDALGCVLGF